MHVWTVFSLHLQCFDQCTAFEHLQIILQKLLVQLIQNVKKLSPMGHPAHVFCSRKQFSVLFCSLPGTDGVVTTLAGVNGTVLTS